MKYLVHIGYPKAASTWLQRVLFSGNDDRIQPLIENEKDKGLSNFKSGGQLLYSPPHSLINGKLEKYVYPGSFDVKRSAKQIQINTNIDAEVTVLSNEVWTGHPFSGGIAYSEYSLRIRQLIPNARILIIIRRQEEAILSAYAHFVTVNGGRCSLENYLNSHKQSQFPWNTPLYYCYNILVEHYCNLFGQSNVFVLPFELLSIKGPSEFVNPIYRFLGMTPKKLPGMNKKENVRDYSQYGFLSRSRIVNMLAKPDPANGNTSLHIPGLYRGITKIGSKLIPRLLVNNYIKRDLHLIKKYFAPFASESNLALQKYTDFDLKKLGYSE
jgi:hypothetical protein